MRILVTAGATREPLDAVRFLTNASTGTTGAALASAWADAGHTVHLLHGGGAVRPAAHAGLSTEEFGATADLEAKLIRRLGGERFDLVVMAAAVADYRPAETHPGKVSSDAPEWTLRLVRTPKLLPQLRRFSSGPVRVVGFKLTAGADPAARRAAVAAQFAAGGVDQVVQNDLHEIAAAGFGRQPFYVYTDPTREPQRHLGAVALAAALIAPSTALP